MSNESGLFDLFNPGSQVERGTEPIDNPPVEGDTEEELDSSQVEHESDPAFTPDEKEGEENDNEQGEGEDDDAEGEEDGDGDGSEVSMFEAIASEMGLDNFDLNGYEEDYSGVAKFVNDYANSHIGNFLNSLETNAPELFELIKAANEGEDYYSMMKNFVSLTPDNWYDMELSEETPSNVLRAVITDELRERGMSDEDIQDFVDYKEQNDKLLPTAQAFHREALENFEENRKAELQAIREQEQAYNQNVTKNIQEVEQILASRKIGNFNIPQNEIGGFSEFLNQYMQTDNSGNIFIPMQANSSESLAAAYLVYKQGDISDVVEKAARTKSANQLKKRLSAAQKEKGSKASANKKNTSKQRGESPSSDLYREFFN